MIQIVIPGYRELSLHYAVMDFNGTLAEDGQLLDGIKRLLTIAAEHLELHIVTADTFGGVESGIKGLPIELAILSQSGQAEAKRQYVRNLGSGRTVAIGNGRNDRLMVKEAALGIAVVETEGAAVETLLAADVVCRSSLGALELLLNPKRLVATLRS